MLWREFPIKNRINFLRIPASAIQEFGLVEKQLPETVLPVLYALIVIQLLYPLPVLSNPAAPHVIPSADLHDVRRLFLLNNRTEL